MKVNLRESIDINPVAVLMVDNENECFDICSQDDLFSKFFLLGRYIGRLGKYSPIPTENIKVMGKPITIEEIVAAEKLVEAEKSTNRLILPVVGNHERKRVWFIFGNVSQFMRPELVKWFTSSKEKSWEKSFKWKWKG